ncbi:hypothetical protein Tco_1070347 [Tanacetum coccineum]|uniref:Uncharacterized protein n=1 Tax=Tanacetum coccineum TaxID=301880 RepID=A0ABQ5HLF8_9ASTR
MGIYTKTNIPSTSLMNAGCLKIVLWYLEYGVEDLDRRCSKLHLCNLYILGTVIWKMIKLAKDNGYGELSDWECYYLQVYYVEGLGHNYFIVGQLCDSNLDVAFRQHPCFIRNQKVLIIDGISEGITYRDGFYEHSEFMDSYFMKMSPESNQFQDSFQNPPSSTLLFHLRRSDWDFLNPKNYNDALTQACWIEAMQRNFRNFEQSEVKLDESRVGAILIYLARLVAQSVIVKNGGIDFEESFAQLHDRGYIEFFLVFCCLHMNNGHLEMDVKTRLNVDYFHVEKSKMDKVKKGKPGRSYTIAGFFLRTKKFADGIMLVVKIHVRIATSGVTLLGDRSCAYGRLKAEKRSRYHRSITMATFFTKALGRERIEFLINKLGMRSFTPETLKQLADEVDE